MAWGKKPFGKGYLIKVKKKLFSLPHVIHKKRRVYNWFQEYNITFVKKCIHKMLFHDNFQWKEKKKNVRNDFSLVHFVTKMSFEN
jgi:hypothetical protein